MSAAPKTLTKGRFALSSALAAIILRRLPQYQHPFAYGAGLSVTTLMIFGMQISHLAYRIMRAL